MKYTMRFLLLLTFSGLTLQGFGQKLDDFPSGSSSSTEDLSIRYANTITASEMKEHLQVLASDAFEGRETGTEGQKKAAEYIARQFKALALPPVDSSGSYFQHIAFIMENWHHIRLSVNGEEKKHLWDYYAYPSTNPDLDSLLFDEVLFLGYGIDTENYSDYEGVEVADKVLLILDGEPVEPSGRSLVTGSLELSDWTEDWRLKLRAARAHGAAGVLIIDRNFKKNMDQARREILNNRLEFGEGEQADRYYLPNAFISSSLAKELVGKKFRKLVRARKKIQKRGNPKRVAIPCTLGWEQKKNVRSIIGENVIGFIEGVDEALKEELVLISAHYDHLGKRGDAIYNGADDNGSGSSTVLEIAEAFTQAREAGQGPRRSVVVLLVSGEEKGLLGSNYYVNHPLFPLENTIVNVNVDMIGRTDEKHKDNPDYIYVIGADRLSSELHEINEQANATYSQLELDYTYNAPSDPNRYYYRSDHYNFAERGIPAIFYFSGTHADYHRVSDTVEKIQFEKMEKVGRLIFHTAWELANRDTRIVVDQKK